MPDWNNATGTQLAIAQDALLDAFPYPSEMEMLLMLRLNKSYAQLTAGSANYRFAVFQILVAARAERWLADLFTAARVENPRNPKLLGLRHLADLTEAQPPTGRQLEDIVRTDGGFEDILPWLRRLDQLRGQVCRIESPVNQAVGTGWLVGKDLLLTNWHVVRRVLAGDRQPTSVTCRFDYATDASGTNPGVAHALATEWCPSFSPASPLELGTGDAGPTGAELDYALLRLAQPVGDLPGPSAAPRGWMTTRRGTAAPPAGSILFLLQHPAGDPLKLAIGVARDTSAGVTRVPHDANTLKGSSGSPCLNAKLDVVALHNAGDPMYDGTIGAPTQNQAVPLEPILASIEASGGPRFWTP